MIELEGVLTIKNKEGALVAIVYHNLKTHMPEIYGISKHGMDEVKSLLESFSVNVVS